MADAIAPSPAPALPQADPAMRARIQKTATAFEASFLQVMLGSMFDTVDTGAFGGGAGEDAFKSFLTDAFAKSMAERGGVGLSKDLTREMLKMQGLS
ncbi:MAG TPA: rod-binding protein [Caulobacteraceae bacterium]